MIAAPTWGRIRPLVMILSCAAAMMAPASAANVELTTEQCEAGVAQLLEDNPKLQQAATNMISDFDMEPTDGGLDLKVPQADIDAYGPLCASVGGELLGIKDDVFDCTKKGTGAVVKVEIENLYDCFPSGCDGYPVEQKATDLWKGYDLECVLETTSGGDGGGSANANSGTGAGGNSGGTGIGANSNSVLDKWQTCQDETDTLMNNNPAVAAAQEKYGNDMELTVSFTKMGMDFPKTDISALTAACKTAGGIMQGFDNDVFDCTKDGQHMEVTVKHMYECMAPSCDGFPVEQLLLAIWSDMSLACTLESSSGGGTPAGDPDSVDTEPLGDAKNSDGGGKSKKSGGIFVMLVIAGVAAFAVKLTFFNGNSRGNGASQTDYEMSQVRLEEIDDSPSRPIV